MDALIRSLNESWAAAPGYVGLYLVSSLGRVKSLRSDRDLVPMMCGGVGKKYKTVRLCDNGRNLTIKVHQLVLIAFGMARFEGAVGCHANGDRLDCRLDNLYWGTVSDNARDRVRHGNHAGSTLTNKQRSEILKRRLAGERGAALSREFNVSQQLVCDILKGRRATRYE